MQLQALHDPTFKSSSLEVDSCLQFLMCQIRKSCFIAEFMDSPMTGRFKKHELILRPHCVVCLGCMSEGHCSVVCLAAYLEAGHAAGGRPYLRNGCQGMAGKFHKCFTRNRIPGAPPASTYSMYPLPPPTQKKR